MICQGVADQEVLDKGRGRTWRDLRDGVCSVIYKKKFPQFKTPSCGRYDLFGLAFHIRPGMPPGIDPTGREELP